MRKKLKTWGEVAGEVARAVGNEHLIDCLVGVGRKELDDFIEGVVPVTEEDHIDILCYLAQERGITDHYDLPGDEDESTEAEISRYFTGLRSQNEPGLFEMLSTYEGFADKTTVSVTDLLNEVFRMADIEVRLECQAKPGGKLQVYVRTSANCYKDPNESSDSD